MISQREIFFISSSVTPFSLRMAFASFKGNLRKTAFVIEDSCTFPDAPRELGIEGVGVPELTRE